MKIFNLLLLVRLFRHEKVGDQLKLGIFLLSNPMLSVKLTPANPLARADSSFCSTSLQPCSSIWAGDMAPAGDAQCWHGLCSEEPKLQVMRGLWGLCVRGATTPEGHQPWWGLVGRLGPPFTLMPVSLCLQVLQGKEWCLAGHRQACRKGRKGCGGREQKELHWWIAEGNMVLFLFLTTGSCEFLHRIILGLRPGCFMLHWCLSFPSSYLNPSDIICNYFKKAEAQGECPWWMAVISVLWLPKSY